MKRRQLIVTGITAYIASPLVRAQIADKPLRIIVPFAPGGSGDLIPRLVAPAMAELLKRPVIVENRAGAGGSIGASYVAKSPPDGLTIGVATVSTHGIYPAVMKVAPYDPLKDFLPISNLARVPNVVSVHPSVPARDMAEFIALARNPRSYLDYGSPGIGSLGNMLGELFKQVAKGYMTHIPYRGAGPALQDALAGQIKVLFDNLPASLPHIKAGRLRALAVAWPSRLTPLPEIPTFAEVNLPALNDSSWFGLVAPVGTATDVIQRIQAATAGAVSRPDVKMRIQDLGAFALGSTAESFEATLRAEFTKWKKVAATGRISLENS